jgi:pyruvate-formate lyase
MTESYQETEGEPEVLRRAKALKKILGEMTIFIDKDELIVGRATGKRKAGPLRGDMRISQKILLRRRLTIQGDPSCKGFLRSARESSYQ